MKTITIHNIDKVLDSKIRERAKKEKKSLNQTVQDMLMEYEGIHNKNKRDDFNEFLGLWNDRDLKEFKDKTSGFEKINKSDWK